MRSNIEAFNVLIEQAKARYAKLELAQEWDSDIWESKGDLAGTNEKASLHFATMNSPKYADSFVINNRRYIDLCKAQIVSNISKKTFSSIQTGILIALKHLYWAQLQVKGVNDPWLLDDAVLTQLESNLVAGGYVDIVKLLSNILTLMKSLKSCGVITVGITFVNTHKKKATTDLKKLIHRHKKNASIDDNERDGEDHLISMKAMHSLVWLTHNATNQWEQVAIRIYHILMVTGFRIGELLRVRHDALISVAEINENTGKPVLVEKLDEDGKPVLDESGKPELEPQLIWGIEYHPEKGHIASYKWLDKTSASIVIAAFDFICKQTTACRAQLEYLEQHPSAPIQWQSETITIRDFNQHFVMTSNGVVNQFIQTIKKRLKRSGVLPVKEIVDTFRVRLKRKGKTPMNPVYRVTDLNRHYHRNDFRLSIRFEMGNKGKRKQVITIKKSELLCIAPAGALGSLKQGSSISYLYPDVLASRALLTLFGKDIKNANATNNSSSIFNRYDLKEEDGSNIYIKTHMPRHQLNTFLALADVAEHQQALIMGRRDIKQNRDYQHLNLKDKTRYQDTTTASMRQRVNNAQQPNDVATAPESEDNLLAELGLAPMGPTPTKLAVQQSAHAFNKPAEHVEFMQEALAENNLLGELQDTFNAIRKENGLQAAKEFIETHGRNFHIVVNGGCTRNLALHGCDKQLRCLDGEGCFHLTITGRPGELDSIRATHQNLSLNVEKMSRLEQAGKLKSRRERDAFEKEKHNLSQMEIVVGKAESFSGFIPIRVFNTTMRLNQTGPKKTVVERFAQDQRKLKKEAGNG